MTSISISATTGLTVQQKGRFVKLIVLMLCIYNVDTLTNAFLNKQVKWGTDFAKPK
ncbi:hypothetical protein B0G80_1340 [Paraburkholderia sp. BL6669N2]|nr:hypothetical protein B0G80_1340 [Paraburkholderia sp. BL6669N2]